MITYGGKPLLLADPERRLEDWLADHLPLEDVVVAARPPHQQSSRWQSLRSGESFRADFGDVPWPDPPPLRLNTLWVPTGATRWTCGLFLVSGKQLEQLAAVPNPSLLALSDTQGHTKQYRLYLLAPRRVSPLGLSGEALYVLPMVDARYFAQGAAKASLRIDPGVTTWAEYLAHYDCLTINSFPTAEPERAFPHPEALFCPGSSDAQRLEWGLAACGFRIVPFGASGFSVQRFADADAVLAANLAMVREIAGGSTSAAWHRGELPAQCRVEFPVYRHGFRLPEDRTHAVTLTPAMAGACHQTVGASAPWMWAISATAYADADDGDEEQSEDYRAGESVITNSTDVENLAKLLAADFFNWAAYSYDVTVPGVATWTPTGFDDGLLFEVGSTGRRLEPDQVLWERQPNYHFQTRIRSLPVNCAPRHFGHYLPPPQNKKWLEECEYWGTLEETLRWRQSAKVRVKRLPSENAEPEADDEDTGRVVRAWDAFLPIDPNKTAGRAIYKGSRVHVAWSREEGKWLVDRSPAAFTAWGFTTTTISAANPWGLINIWRRDPADPGSVFVPTDDKLYARAMPLPSQYHFYPPGFQVRLDWHEDDATWYLTTEPPREHWGRLYSPCAPGGSGLVDIYYLTQSGQERYTGQQITARGGFLVSGEMLLSGTEVIVSWFPWGGGYPLDYRGLSVHHGTWMITGPRWPAEYEGVLSYTLAKGGSALVITTQGLQIEAIDRLLTTEGSSLAAGTRVFIRWMRGLGWVVYAASCGS